MALAVAVAFTKLMLSIVALLSAISTIAIIVVVVLVIVFVIGKVKDSCYTASHHLLLHPLRDHDLAFEP